MPKWIIGIWMHDFNKILSSNCKNTSIIWIYRWTRQGRCWQPVQFRQVGRFALNRTRIDTFGVLKTWTANLGNCSLLTWTWIQTNSSELWLTPIVIISMLPPKNKWQWSVIDFWTFILDNQWAKRGRQPIINVMATFVGKNACYSVTTTSKEWVPTERQQVLQWYKKLHGNELHCIVSKLSFEWILFAIWLCIQLHNYACDVSLIWLFSCF